MLVQFHPRQEKYVDNLRRIVYTADKAQKGLIFENRVLNFVLDMENCE